MSNFDKISGMLVYVCLDKPVKAYQKAGTPPKSDEWKASVVLTDEDYVDELEEHAKKFDTQLSLKKVKRTEFENIYKVAPPESDGKNLWVLTLRKSTQLGKTGKEVPDVFKPRVYEKQGNRTVEITHTKLVGNGSMGTISVDTFVRDNGTASFYLKNVLVTDLVEYVRDESSDYQPGSEFDEADDGNGGTVKVPASAKTKAAPKAKKTAPSSGFDDMDDNIPF